MVKTNKKQNSQEVLEEFLKKDTFNFKNFKSSLSGKIYFQEQIVEREREKSLKIQLELEKLEIEFDKNLREIESFEPKSPFEKIKWQVNKKKLIKKLESERLKKYKILTEKNEKLQKSFQLNRENLQQLINRLQEYGILWSELKRLISEKIALGFIIFENQNKKSEVNQKSTVKIHSNLTSSDNVTDSEGGKTVKEKNLISKNEFYMIKGLTKQEKNEYRNILKHMLYFDKKCPDPVIALKLRMALIDLNDKKLNNLILRTSNVALFDDIFSIFSKDKDFIIKHDLDYYFKREKAFDMLQKSGYNKIFIEKNAGIYASELEYLFSSQRKMNFIFDELKNYNLDDQKVNLKFESVVKREINRRLALKQKLGIVPAYIK